MTAVALSTPPARALVVLVPGLRTVCEANRSRHEHRFTKAKRVKEQRHMVTLALQARAVRCPLQPPLQVVLTRFSAGSLDPFDNLPSSLKAVADAVAAWAGVDDRDPRVISFQARQAKAPRGTYGVRIEVREWRLL
jgi:hypothetical protein